MGSRKGSWLVIRKNNFAREAFQRGVRGEGDGGGEDLDPDEDLPFSGPDAGGGEPFLPAAEWKVQASSMKYTMLQVDQDRCGLARMQFPVCVLTAHQCVVVSCLAWCFGGFAMRFSRAICSPLFYSSSYRCQYLLENGSGVAPAFLSTVAYYLSNIIMP